MHINSRQPLVTPLLFFSACSMMSNNFPQGVHVSKYTYINPLMYTVTVKSHCVANDTIGIMPTTKQLLIPGHNNNETAC